MHKVILSIYKPINFVPEQPTAEVCACTFQADILLAEDNEVNQMVAMATLENAGCRVDVAENGNQVLSMLEKKNYDLIPMDIQMPEMDGYEATRLIRQREKRDGHRQKPIIAITANALKGDREECLAAGMSDFLSKPFTQRDLIAVLKQWLPESTLRCKDEFRSDSRTLQSEENNPGKLEIVEGVIDQTALAAISALSPQDPDWLGKVVKKYIATSGALISAIEDGYLRDDNEAIIRSAHTLKSSSASLGVMDLAEMAKAIESAVRLGGPKRRAPWRQSWARHSHVPGWA